MSFAFCSLILCALTYGILSFCRGMSLGVDSFCIHTLHKDGINWAVHRWNGVQALLRKTSATVTEALCVLQVVVFFIFLIGGAVVYQSVQEADVDVSLLIPMCIVALGMSRVFFKAADVTDRCARVPSLINSCDFGADIDRDRQYIVEYVQNSAAGFYFFEIRLTSGMTFKFSYVCAIGLLSVGARLMQ